MNKSLKERMKKEKYKLLSIDLFSGPGGLCTGFKWVGILPLIAVEWTESTVQTYATSHNAEIFDLNNYLKGNKTDEKYLNKFMKESTQSLIIQGDINQVDSQIIKGFLYKRYGIDSENETVDIVSGGAPCESFSIAGTRKIGDERDDLFSNILRISRTINAKTILFENVKGLFSKSKNKKKGAMFEYICNKFESKKEKVCYNLVSRNPEKILLKACDYGVPQSRERLFLVGIRNDLKNVEFSYPKKEFGPECSKPYVTVEEAISDLPIVNMGEESTLYKVVKKYKTENQQDFVAIMRGKYNYNGINSNVPAHLTQNGLFNEKSISCHKGPGHVKRKQELLALIKERESMRSAFERLTKAGKIEKYRHLFPNTIYGSRNRRLLKDEPSFTVTSHCLDEILHPTINRAITPREAARLQSFPDWYQFIGPYVQFHGDKIQDKYEQIGDAVPPLLAAAIGKQFIKCLNSLK